MVLFLYDGREAASGLESPGVFEGETLPLLPLAEAVGKIAAAFLRFASYESEGSPELPGERSEWLITGCDPSVRSASRLAAVSFIRALYFTAESLSLSRPGAVPPIASAPDTYPLTGTGATRPHCPQMTAPLLISDPQ